MKSEEKQYSIVGLKHSNHFQNHVITMISNISLMHQIIILKMFILFNQKLLQIHVFWIIYFWKRLQVQIFIISHYKSLSL